MEWYRIQQALRVEEKNYFCDVVGHEYTFSQFISKNLNDQPNDLSKNAASLWKEIKLQFLNYTDLNLFQRQQLVEHTQQFFTELETQTQEFKDSQAEFYREMGIDVSDSWADDNLVYSDCLGFCINSHSELEAIEYDPTLTIAQKIELINGRKIFYSGRVLNYEEYLAVKGWEDGIDFNKEENFNSYIDCLHLNKCLELEERFGLQDLVTRLINSSNLIFPYLYKEPNVSLENVSVCTREIRISKFICSSLRRIPDLLPVDLTYQLRELALKFSHYRKINFNERNSLVKKAKRIFSKAYIEFELLPENRPQWTNEYNIFAYFDNFPNSIPDDDSVDARYVKKLKSHISKSVNYVARLNSLLRAYFKDKGRLPENSGELNEWLTNKYFKRSNDIKEPYDPYDLPC